MDALFLKPPQVCFLGSGFALAATEMVTQVVDGANKVGTMGMQALLALMLAVIGAGLWYSERQRTAERLARDEKEDKKYDLLQKQLHDVTEQARVDRAVYLNDLKAGATEMRGLTERSIVAMHATATSVDALREFLGARRIGESHAQQMDRLRHES